MQSQLFKKLNLKSKNINADAAKDIAIAGYSLGRDTLYKNVNSMLPGDVIILSISKRNRKNYAIHISARGWQKKRGIAKIT